MAAGGEQDSQPVVGEVAEAVRESAGLLDDEVDRLGAAVADAVGVEVGQELVPPGAEGAAESGDLGAGQVWKLSSTRIASAFPSAARSWW